MTSPKTKQYPYARFHARSEKHLTDALNMHVGKGRWMKTKRMIDTYAQGNRTGDKDDVPVFPQDEAGNGGWGYANQVYRGVIFKDEESASLAKLFINTVENQQPDDMVLCRSFHDVKVNDAARYWSVGEKGLPWESREEGRE